MQPPGIRRLQTTNDWTFNPGTEEEFSSGACSPMSTTWCANLLCGGDPCGDAVMAVPKVIMEMHLDATTKFRDNPPEPGTDFAPEFCLHPQGLTELDAVQSNFDVKPLAEFLGWMASTPVTVWANLRARDGSVGHAIAFSTRNNRLLFFDPNFGVYEMDLGQWQINLPVWMSVNYKTHHYDFIDFYPVELTEVAGRRQQRQRRETRRI